MPWLICEIHATQYVIWHLGLILLGLRVNECVSYLEKIKKTMGSSMMLIRFYPKIKLLLQRLF